MNLTEQLRNATQPTLPGMENVHRHNWVDISTWNEKLWTQKICGNPGCDVAVPAIAGHVARSLTHNG